MGTRWAVPVFLFGCFFGVELSGSLCGGAFVARASGGRVSRAAAAVPCVRRTELLPTATRTSGAFADTLGTILSAKAPCEVAGCRQKLGSGFVPVGRQVAGGGGPKSGTAAVGWDSRTRGELCRTSAREAPVPRAAPAAPHWSLLRSPRSPGPGLRPPTTPARSCRARRAECPRSRQTPPLPR